MNCWMSLGHDPNTMRPTVCGISWATCPYHGIWLWTMLGDPSKPKLEPESCFLLLLDFFMSVLQLYESCCVRMRVLLSSLTVFTGLARKWKNEFWSANPYKMVQKRRESSHMMREFLGNPMFIIDWSITSAFTSANHKHWHILRLPKDIIREAIMDLEQNRSQCYEAK